MRRREGGFTYLGLIILVFILGLVGAATLKVGALLQRAQLETELLETGAQFSTALKTYAEATPRGQPPQPTSLQELLRDTRFPNPRRHLRKIFVDPVSGRAEWGLVRAAEGGRILGVYSLSQATPLKQANFDARFPGFGNREHLSEWKFMAAGQEASAPGSAPPRPRLAPGMPAPPGTPQLPGTPVPPGTALPPAQEPVPAPPEPEPEPPAEEPPAPEPEPEERPSEPEVKEPVEPPPPAQESGR